MGSCLSSFTSSSPPHHYCKPHGIGNRPPPPPPPLDEESVKQVLSETHKPKLLTVPTKSHQSCYLNLNLGIPIHPTQQISDQTPSTTTTLTDNMDDYEAIRLRISRSPAKLPNHRSLSHDCIPRRDRSVGKSPSRKSDQSPGRINGGTVKYVQSRDMGQGRLARRSLRPEPRLQNRTDSSSYRRSRSPATTRTDGVLSRTAAGRSPSVRRSGMSPGRDYYRKEAAKESLDNPLVSLECFIFL